MTILLLSSCSGGPEAAVSTGVPAAWYAAVTAAVQANPDVAAVALLENGGPCGLRSTITVDGRTLADVADHGVVRVDGVVPAVSCSWYEGTPVEVVVARADDDAGYADLVAGTAARQQRGNVQTGREVVVGKRTLQVVRTQYPTNPSAGTDFIAYYLDPVSKGRVGLQVSNSTGRSTGYDEQAVAGDLARFLNG